MDQKDEKKIDQLITKISAYKHGLITGMCENARLVRAAEMSEPFNEIRLIIKVDRRKV